MLVTYRMGHMALDGYHTLCCADKGSESGMSLRAGDKPHHTASALVVINSDDDSGILPQRTEHALHCQDRVMPSYRYFAVMAHIALEFLMKYDECALLTCYKLQKGFLLPLLVKSISSLANLRKLDKFTASHHVQAKLSFIDPANLNDYNDRLHEMRWACKDADDTDKMVPILPPMNLFAAAAATVPVACNRKESCLQLSKHIPPAPEPHPNRRNQASAAAPGVL